MVLQLSVCLGLNFKHDICENMPLEQIRLVVEIRGQRLIVRENPRLAPFPEHPHCCVHFHSGY